MAVVTIQATNTCPGGNHVRIHSAIDGGPGKDYNWVVDEMMEALDEISQREGTLTLIKIHGIGKTPAQLKADLLAGLTLTI